MYAFSDADDDDDDEEFTDGFYFGTQSTSASSSSQFVPVHTNDTLSKTALNKKEEELKREIKTNLFFSSFSFRNSRTPFQIDYSDENTPAVSSSLNSQVLN